MLQNWTEWQGKKKCWLERFKVCLPLNTTGWLRNGQSARFSILFLKVLWQSGRCSRATLRAAAQHGNVRQTHLEFSPSSDVQLCQWPRGLWYLRGSSTYLKLYRGLWFIYVKAFSMRMFGRGRGEPWCGWEFWGQLAEVGSLYHVGLRDHIQVLRLLDRRLYPLNQLTKSSSVLLYITCHILKHICSVLFKTTLLNVSLKFAVSSSVCTSLATGVSPPSSKCLFGSSFLLLSAWRPRPLLLLVVEFPGVWTILEGIFGRKLLRWFQWA